MLRDWFEVSTKYGRRELVNNLRTYRLAKKLNISGVRPCGCQSIDLLSCFELPSVKLPGECDSTEVCGEAPWLDSTYPASQDFAGLLVTSVIGYETSFERELSPLPFSGQTVGPLNELGKCITFEGILVSKTQAAREYGISYYSELLRTLGECGEFTLWSASSCPPSNATCDDVGKFLRYMPRTFSSSGPKIIESISTNCSCCDTDCGRGAYFTTIQFTLCSEQSYIYTLPDMCVENEMFDKDDCTCPIVWSKPKYVMQSKKVKRSRKIYQLQLRSDGSVCRLGGWEWSETQLGGGPGIVEIIQPEDNSVSSSTTDKVTSDTDCGLARTISAKYDCSAGGGQIGFSTDNWAFPDWASKPTEVPCDVQISTYWAYDPGDLSSEIDPDTGEVTNTGSPPKWESSNATSSDNCCKASIQWTSATAGVVVPIADPEDEWSIPYDPSRELPSGECDWPPTGCNIQIISTPCEEDKDEVEDCDDFYECPVIIDTDEDMWELVNKPEPTTAPVITINPITPNPGTGSAITDTTGLPPVRERCTASYYTDRTILAFASKYRSDNGAAHKTLPAGTKVWVTYQGKTVEVIIDDRGPYIDGRCIDLQETEFAMLAPLSQGILPDVELRWW